MYPELLFHKHFCRGKMLTLKRAVTKLNMSTLYKNPRHDVNNKLTASAA